METQETSQSSQGGLQVNVPAVVESTFVINGEPWTRLYHASGKSIACAEADAGDYLAQGWTREPFDLGALREEMEASVRVLQTAITTATVHIGQATELDPAEEGAFHAAEIALQRVLDKWEQYTQVVTARLPMKQVDQPDVPGAPPPPEAESGSAAPAPAVLEGGQT